MLAHIQSELLVEYIPTEQNLGPDLLSRWDKGEHIKQRFQTIRQHDWKQEEIPSHWININSDW